MRQKFPDGPFVRLSAVSPESKKVPFWPEKYEYLLAYQGKRKMMENKNKKSTNRTHAFR
jgi:hypothetical protein